MPTTCELIHPSPTRFDDYRNLLAFVLFTDCSPNRFGALDRDCAVGSDSRGPGGRRARGPVAGRESVPSSRSRVSADMAHDRLVLPAQVRTRESARLCRGGSLAASAHSVRQERSTQT